MHHLKQKPVLRDGGACVALVEAGKGEAIAQEVIEKYKRSGYTGRILVPEIS